MRKLLFALGMTGLLAAVPVFAAELPVKAAPATTNSPTTGGWYWGLGTSVGIAQSSLSSSLIIPTNVTADGGTLDAEIGWVGSIGGNWARLAVDGSYENITAGVGPVSEASRWAVTERADINAELIQEAVSLTGINLGNFPTFANPSAAVPSGLKVGTPIQYLGFILREEGVNGSIGSFTGTTVLIAPGVETGWMWPLLNSNGLPNGTALDVFAQVDFPTKGLQVSGLFSNPPSAPVVQTGNIGIATEARVGIHLLLP